MILRHRFSDPVRVAGAVVVIIALFLFAGASSLAQPTNEQDADMRIWLSTLDQGLSAEIRRVAVRRLLEMDHPAALEALAQRLIDYDRPERVRIITGALREIRSPPQSLLDTLIDAVQEAPEALVPAFIEAMAVYSPHGSSRLIDSIRADGATREQRETLLTALRRFPTLDAVEELIYWLDPGQDAELRAAARESLVELTGHTEFDDSVDAWRSWWEQLAPHGREALLELYRHRLEQRLAEKSEALEALRRDRDALEADLTAAIEGQYALTPVAQRGDFLVRLLNSPRSSLRQLALSLVERAIINAESIDPKVIDAVANRLHDDQPAIRQSAVRQLALVDAERLSRRAIELLEKEENQSVRNSLFAALAQTPTPDAAPILLDRLARPGDRPGALAALTATARAGMVDEETLTQAARILLEATATENSPDRFRPDELEALAMSALPAATDLVVRLLAAESSATETTRTAVARGLSWSGRADDELVEHAAQPGVYPWAARAMSRQPTLEALRGVIELPAPTPEAQLEAIDRLMQRLPPSTWLEADRILDRSGAADRDHRLNWLRRALNGTSETGAATGNGENGSSLSSPIDATLRRRLCLRVAELALASGQPALAIESLNAAPVSDEDQETLDRRRRVALVALGRFGELTAQASLEDWLAGGEVVTERHPLDSARLEAILDEITARFGDLSMSPEQQDRITALETALAEATAPTEPRPSDSPPAEIGADDDPGDGG